MDTKIKSILLKMQTVSKLFLQLQKETLRPSEELYLANKELEFQNGERQKRAAELVIANKELAFQNEEKERRAEELIIANKELLFQNEEKEKRAEELIVTNMELKKKNDGLEKMLFMISHKVRQPITQILGLSSLLEKSINSPEKLKVKIDFMKQSALALDSFTRELTAFINDLLNPQLVIQMPQKNVSKMILPFRLFWKFIIPLGILLTTWIVLN